MSDSSYHCSLVSATAKQSSCQPFLSPSTNPPSYKALINDKKLREDFLKRVFSAKNTNQHMPEYLPAIYPMISKLGLLKDRIKQYKDIKIAKYEKLSNSDNRYTQLIYGQEKLTALAEESNLYCNKMNRVVEAYTNMWNKRTSGEEPIPMLNTIIKIAETLMVIDYLSCCTRTINSNRKIYYGKLSSIALDKLSLRKCDEEAIIPVGNSGLGSPMIGIESSASSRGGEEDPMVKHGLDVVKFDSEFTKKSVINNSTSETSASVGISDEAVIEHCSQRLYESFCQVFLPKPREITQLVKYLLENKKAVFVPTSEVLSVRDIAEGFVFGILPIGICSDLNNPYSSSFDGVKNRPLTLFYGHDIGHALFSFPLNLSERQKKVLSDLARQNEFYAFLVFYIIHESSAGVQSYSNGFENKDLRSSISMKEVTELESPKKKYFLDRLINFVAEETNISFEATQKSVHDSIPSFIQALRENDFGS